MKRRVSVVLLSLATFSGGDALADKPFVDRALTLAPFHFSADAGVGFGQYQGLSTDAAGNTTSTGMKLGWGSNLEAAVGLPFLGEIGVALG